MTVTTIAPTVTPATVAPKATGRTVTKADLEALGADQATLVRDIRAKWHAAEISQTQADDAFSVAERMVADIRVVKSRIVYAAAMVTPFKGEPNLKASARILLSTQPGDKAADAKAERAKNSLRPYLLAGIALAQHVTGDRTAYTASPDDVDREVVAAAFDAFNAEQAKARKAEAKAKRDAAKADESAESGESEGRATDPTDDEALTFAHILAKLAQANNALTVFIENGGKVTTSDVDTFNAAAATLAARLEELAS
jgi:hypothetical protein